MPVIWTRPDGSLIVQRLRDTYVERERLPDETTAQTVLRLALVTQAKVPTWVGLTPQLVTEADIPADRSQRHKWRLQNGKVKVDPTVPDPPDPKKAGKDAIDAALDLNALKQVLKTLI